MSNKIPDSSSPSGDAGSALFPGCCEYDALLDKILDSLSAQVALINRKGVIVSVNKAWSDFQGKVAETAPWRGEVGCPYLGDCGEDLSPDLAEARKGLARVLEGECDSFVFEYCADCATRKQWFLMRIEACEGELCSAVVSHLDISDRKELEDHLLHKAFYDNLTGLPNRALLLDRLDRAIKRHRLNPTRSFALIYMDLDRFTLVNESLGYVAGDGILMGVANRLQRLLRPVDTISRFGGDEFVLLLEDMGAAGNVVRVADKVTKALAEPFRVRKQEIYVSASLGLVAQCDYGDPGQMIRDAGSAMHCCKEMGGQRYCLFSEDMRDEARRRLQVESDLRRALKKGGLRLYYQPIFSIEKGRMIGLEALARWEHPKYGLIAPQDFIPVAEETGLIIPLGEWVLREACLKLREIERVHPESGITMSVNISGRQFKRPQFLSEVEEILRETGVDPSLLKFELTESVVMDDAERAVEVFTRLKMLGVSVVIDDFGTGYSSLSYLQRFPVDTLKVDKSFVGKMELGPENREIVKTIINMAHNLGMEVVAEGVELHEHLAFLSGLRCESGQGYLFSRPLSTQDLKTFLAERVGIQPDAESA